MPREFCWTCRRPKAACLCPSEPPLDTSTRIVLLMHPMEWKREKCTTGRLACLNLANSEIIAGLAFDGNPRFRALVDDRTNFPVLLYPGKGALELGGDPLQRETLGRFFGDGQGGNGKRLVVFLIDATWACAKAVARASPELMALPRLAVAPRERSRWLIKRQPAEWCLSTIEAIHELLLALDEAGLDAYDNRTRLLDVFARMQEYQIARHGTPGRNSALAAHRPGLDFGA